MNPRRRPSSDPIRLHLVSRIKFHVASLGKQFATSKDTQGSAPYTKQTAMLLPRARFYVQPLKSLIFVLVQAISPTSCTSTFRQLLPLATAFPQAEPPCPNCACLHVSVGIAIRYFSPRSSVLRACYVSDLGEATELLAHDLPSPCDGLFS